MCVFTCSDRYKLPCVVVHLMIDSRRDKLPCVAVEINPFLVKQMCCKLNQQRNEKDKIVDSGVWVCAEKIT